MGILGTWAAIGPIERVTHPQLAWIAWIVVILSTGVSIYGSAYTCFLVGANRIELQKRWEAVVGGIALLAQATVFDCWCWFIRACAGSTAWPNCSGFS